MDSIKTFTVQRPSTDSALANRLHKVLKDISEKEVLVRGIGSQDHPGKTKAELLQHILKTGTDKYDDSKKMIGHDYYKKWNIDFFATPVKTTKSKETFLEILKDFRESAVKDRGYAVEIDLVLIYDSKKCSMVRNVYEGHENSDAYTFRQGIRKQDALLGVIEIT